MIANPLVLDENPLADVRNTRSLQAVILKGRVIDVSSSVALRFSRPAR